MRSEWPEVRLGDHVDACLGKMLDVKKNKGTPEPYLGNSNVRWGTFDLVNLAEMRFEPHEEERYGLLSGDLIVCEGGEPGRCAIWTGTNSPRMKIQKALHRIRPKGNLNNYFLYYWFCFAAKAGLLEQHFTGTTIKHLTGKAIAALTIPLPPIEFQMALVDVLKTLDDCIALLRETNATLEAIVQALFKSWFVDFDPVHARARGEQPAGLAPEVAALFPDSFEESALGLVPNGWKFGHIYDAATVIYGAPFASKRFNTERKGLPLIRIRDLKNETPGVYTDEVHPKGYLTQPGDIVVGMDGEFRAYLWGGQPAWLNQRVCVFKPISGHSSAFIHYTIKPQLAAVEATEIATTVIHLGKNDIDRFSALIPDVGVIRAFSDVANPFYAQIIENKQKAQTLANLRDTLLPRLISGQLRLPDTEQQLKDLAV